MILGLIIIVSFEGSLPAAALSRRTVDAAESIDGPFVPSSKEYVSTLNAQKNLRCSEALYEKLPRLHQPLLAPLRVRNNADHHQHPGHAGEQQPNFRQSFFSRPTRNKWQ